MNPPDEGGEEHRRPSSRSIGGRGFSYIKKMAERTV